MYNVTYYFFYYIIILYIKGNFKLYKTNYIKQKPIILFFYIQFWDLLKNKHETTTYAFLFCGLTKKNGNKEILQVSRFPGI